MKLHLALSLCIFGSQVWLVQTQQSQAYADFLNKISSFVTSVTNVISGPTELKTLRDVPGCGKRNTRENKESTLAECLWDCEWNDAPNEAYEKLYKTFVRTPVRYKENKVDEEAVYDDPKDIFPNSYVDSKEIQYGKEDPKTKNFYVDQFMSLPRLPTKTECLKDCIYPLNIRETRIRVCVQAAKEWFQTPQWTSVQNKFGDPPLIIFYECMIALNVETISEKFKDEEIRRTGKSFSRDYEMLAVEICFLAERDWWLHFVSDRTWTDFVMDDLTQQNPDQTQPDWPLRQGCDEIFRILLSAITGEANYDITKPNGRDYKNNTNAVFQKYRYSGELAKEDLILRADNKKDDDRLTGASIFPTDLDLTQNSQHHPWACSLRTRGYRGRHRCGVTLLYGPRKDKSDTHDDPYVLVSAAHCNYICKDRISGDVLETCCCRPPNTEGSCAPNSGDSSSPFCTGQPVFTLAEPKDVVIICGEFNSGVEILTESAEPEQLFTVTKIIQHPNYKPTTADIGKGSGGPIDGNDIAVYHVNHHGFLLGENVKVRVTNNEADARIDKSSESYIWPVCLPKDDTDKWMDPNVYPNHPSNVKGTVNAMLAGWLDAPPISQAFSNLLGSSLKEADVLKLYYYPRVMGLEEQDECIDPEYQMKENKELTNILGSTFYPKGTICFKDPAASSCPEFGSSGSGVVREWKKREDKKTLSIDDACNPFSSSCSVNDPSNSPIDQTNKPVDAYQYSFVGPLSMQKGCDNAFHMYSKKIDTSSKGAPPSNNGIGYSTNKLSYRGENPLVATDARCFMPWIASQYNMKLEEEYEERANCKKGKGRRDNIDQKICLANFLGQPKMCDFTLCEDINEKECTAEKKWDKCRVLSKEGIAFNVNECLIKLSDKEIDDLGLPGQAHYRATCFNNCKGVNPNAITAAGVALVALSGISSTAGLGPGAVGIGGAVLAGREVMNSMNRCGEGCCRMNNRCCQLVPRRQMMVCPRNPKGCKACQT